MTENIVGNMLNYSFFRMKNILIEERHQLINNIVTQLHKSQLIYPAINTPYILEFHFGNFNNIIEKICNKTENISLKDLSYENEIMDEHNKNNSVICSTILGFKGYIDIGTTLCKYWHHISRHEMNKNVKEHFMLIFPNAKDECIDMIKNEKSRIVHRFECFGTIIFMFHYE